MKPHQKYTFSDGKVLEIHQDDNPESPREWGTLGTMACFHERYRLGDEDHGIDPKCFSNLEEIREYIGIKLDAVICWPLFLYDHSGLRIKVHSFDGQVPQGHAKFDSGQVGFIFVTEERIRSEFPHMENRIELAKECLRDEVDEYDKFLSGDVWGYRLLDVPCKECGKFAEEIDSCWGFYGDNPLENGMLGNLPIECRLELERMV